MVPSKLRPGRNSNETQEVRVRKIAVEERKTPEVADRGSVGGSAKRSLSDCSADVGLEAPWGAGVPAPEYMPTCRAKTSIWVFGSLSLHFQRFRSHLGPSAQSPDLLTVGVSSQAIQG